MGFKLAFNQHFWSKIVAGYHQIVETIRIWIRILYPNSIYIQNWLNLIEIGQKRPDFGIFNVAFDINPFLIELYDLLSNYFDILIELFDLFNNLLIELDRL